MKRILLVLLILGSLGGMGGWYLYSADTHPTSFRTVPVERGDMLATISATGTIEPEEVIDVGAQVQGQILKFGDDPRSGGRLIDFSSPVEGPCKGWLWDTQGTLLALIDTKLYKAQVDRANAQLLTAQGQVESADAQVELAQANLDKAIADLGQMKAKLTQAERDWNRAVRLSTTRGAITDAEVDLARANYETTQATLKVGEATVKQMKAALKDSGANVKKSLASVEDMKAALENSRINLGYCEIRSPVKGVIIDRRVNIGQTVVSSLNAPSLFLIAKDLKRLQVWASVNEADIGSIFPGQTVTFTVDAYPKRVFKGTVAPDSPRLNASMTQNVVTYTVVVNTDNSDGKLLPYLTATLRFEVSKRSQVLMVPNAALRWKPNPQSVVPELRADYARTMRTKKASASDGPPGGQAPGAEKEPSDHGMLWIAAGKFVKPIKVQLGLSDGLNTEIETGELQEGDNIVIGESKGNAGVGTKNPFAPKMFGK